MTTPIDYEHSFVLARKALKHMEARRSKATPRNYEVWFNYLAGGNRLLIEDLNAVLERDEVLSDDEAERLYDEHLNGEKLAVDVDKIGHNLHAEFSQVMSVLEAASDKTQAYGDSLGSLSEQLDGEIGETALGNIVSTLVASTKQMEADNEALQRHLEESRSQIEDLNNALEQVRSESRIDQLTEIPNRKHFDETLAKEIAAADAEGHDVCLLIGDIDHFKQFNDTYGHQTGDKVLRLVAQALRASIRGEDNVARYGGEEFVVILPRTTLEEAVTIGNDIREAVRAKELVRKSTGESLGVITMSFGIACYRAGEESGDLIHRADSCLYVAKKVGRNQVRCETDPEVEQMASISAVA